MKQNNNYNNVLKKGKKEKGLQDWEDEALQGHYLRQAKEVTFGFRMEI